VNSNLFIKWQTKTLLLVEFSGLGFNIVEMDSIKIGMTQ